MAETTVRAVFQGMMEQIRKSKYPLSPVYEALANSLEAILQKDAFRVGEEPRIKLTFEFSGLLKESKYLGKIVVEDNGIGFDDTSFSRFETLLDKSKGYNNRGSGRIQFVHRFGRVDVTSFYSNRGKHLRRRFSCSSVRFVYDNKVEDDPENRVSGTVMSLSASESLGRDKEYFDTLSINEVTRNLKRHLLLRYYLESKKRQGRAPVIAVIFTHNGEIFDHGEIRPDDMPKPTETGNVVVNQTKLKDPKSSYIDWQPVIGKEQILKWAHFRLSEGDLDHNAVWLCSKGVTVTQLNYDVVMKYESVQGHRYLTAFYGDVLDKEDNVSDSVDSFRFPDRKKIEEEIREGD